MRVLRIMLVAALLGGVPTAAFAGGDGSGNGGVGGDDNVFAAVQGIHYGHPPSGTGADSSGCHWLRDSSGIIDDAFFANDKVIGGVTYKAFLKSCPGALPVLVWVPQLSARGVAQAALDYVTERLPAPTVLSAPSADKGVVGVGMWFWTDPARYRSVSVTAWIPGVGGPIWATTTAVPTALVFDSGDAERGGASCIGPGIVWSPVFGDEVPSPCMYTYQHASVTSPTGFFTARLSIRWSISWQSNAGAGGDLGGYVTSSTQLMTVDEIEAVISH